MSMTPTTDKTQNCKPAAQYRTHAPREDGWTFERQATFLMALAETGLVSAACKVADMSVASAYALRREARGVAFHLGWQAANLLARDRLEDVLLEAAISGVECVTTRAEGVTRRRTLNGNMSMAMLNRLDRRAIALDDRAAAAARSIGSAFEVFIMLVLSGGGAEEITAFLAEHPDPLAAQVAAHEASLRAQRAEGDQRSTNPVPPPEMDCRASLAMTSYEIAPQLVEESAIFSTLPCDCHADREMRMQETA
jgi:hypothetical protein